MHCRFIIYLLLISFGLAKATFAAENSAEERRVYKVGVEDISYYPIQDFKHEPGRGAVKEILDRFSAESGIEFEYIPLPIQRFHRWYDNGAIDFRVPDNPNWTHKSQPELIYSDPLIRLCETFIVKQEHKTLPIGSVRKIGTIYGFTPSSIWHERIERGEVEVIADPSLKVLTRMLLNDMVNGLDLDLATVRYQLSKLSIPQDRVTVSQTIPHPSLGYRMSTLKHREIMNTFNLFLAENEMAISQAATFNGVTFGSHCEHASVGEER